jgi:hypothetical protein
MDVPAVSIVSALRHAEAATKTPRWLMERVRSDPDYDYEKAELYKCLADMYAVAHPAPSPKPPPVPTPPPPVTTIPAQRIVLMSGTIDTPADWLTEYLATPGALILFSADLNLSKPGQPYYVTDQQLGKITAAGRSYGWWCDGTDTPISSATKLQATRGGIAVMGQWENDAQYDALINSGVGLGVGDAANLSGPRREDAIRRANNGELRLTGEMMWCNPAYSAMGVPIQSVTLYTDRDGAQGGYQPLTAFSALPEVLRRTCCLYTGGRSTPADWATWRSWIGA